MFRGDVHHCGSEYSTQNDRMHYYLEPVTTTPISRKRNRTTTKPPAKNKQTTHLYNVKNDVILHTLASNQSSFYGLAFEKQSVWCLCQKKSNSRWIDWRKNKAIPIRILRAIINDDGGRLDQQNCLHKILRKKDDIRSHFLNKITK